MHCARNVVETMKYRQRSNTEGCVWSVVAAVVVIVVFEMIICRRKELELELHLLVTYNHFMHVIRMLLLLLLLCCCGI